MHDAFQQMLHTWTNGGWVMAALATVAVIAYGSCARLLISLYHRGLKRTSDSDIKSWVSKPTEAPRRLRELIRYTQDEVRSLHDIEGRFREVEAGEVHAVDRQLAFVSVLVVSAPLFGLLGTVLGMLLTFKAISIGGSSTSDVIARGISEALVATQGGMMVAIPGLMLTHVAKRWRSEYVVFLTRLESITLRHFRAEFRGMTRTFVRANPKPAAPATQAPIALIP